MASALEVPARATRPCVKKYRHLVLGNPFLLHGIGELPGNDFINRLRLGLFENDPFLQEVIQASAHVLAAHCSNSLLRLRANAQVLLPVYRITCTGTSSFSFFQACSVV
jgi:hypothetical protein